MSIFRATIYEDGLEIDCNNDRYPLSNYNGFLTIEKCLWFSLHRRQ